MNCEQVNACLDLLMDGELDDSRRRAMEQHGQNCPACARAIQSTLQMKALMSEMEPEVDVPLAAQAKWRGAVREAARQDRRRKLTRWIGSAAAAVVVLVGVTLAVNGGSAPKQRADSAKYAVEEAAMDTTTEEAAFEEDALETAGEAADYEVDAPAMLMAEAPAENAVIEADGAQPLLEIEEARDAGECAAVAMKAPAAEFALRVKDADAACRQIADLAQEYEGEAIAQRLEDGGANVYVTMDAANAADFLNAVVPMDLEGRAADLPEQDGGTIQLLLTVTQE